MKRVNHSFLKNGSPFFCGSLETALAPEAAREIRFAARTFRHARRADGRAAGARHAQGRAGPCDAPVYLRLPRKGWMRWRLRAPRAVAVLAHHAFLATLAPPSNEMPHICRRKFRRSGREITKFDRPERGSRDGPDRASARLLRRDLFLTSIPLLAVDGRPFEVVRTCRRTEQTSGTATRALWNGAGVRGGKVLMRCGGWSVRSRPQDPRPTFCSDMRRLPRSPAPSSDVWQRCTSAPSGLSRPSRPHWRPQWCAAWC